MGNEDFLEGMKEVETRLMLPTRTDRWRHGAPLLIDRSSVMKGAAAEERSA